jgi:BolA protein
VSDHGARDIARLRRNPAHRKAAQGALRHPGHRPCVVCARTSGLYGGGGAGPQGKTGLGKKVTSAEKHIMTQRADRIRQALETRFQPALLEITDDSARHAGHAGASPGGETHYSVHLVAAAFAGMNRVARSRAVHEALAVEFAAGLHALALRLQSPDEAKGS